MTDIGRLMRTVPVCQITDPVDKILSMVTEANGTVAVVVKEGRPVGVVTAARLASSQPATGLSADLVLPVPVVSPESSPEDLLQLSTPWVVVCGAEGILGTVSREDLLEEVLGRQRLLNQEMRVMLDSAANAIVAINLEQKIILCNRPFEKVVGQPLDQILGRPIKAVVPNAGLQQVLDTGKPQAGARIQIRGNTYVSNRNPVFLDGVLVGAVAVLQDVTELEEAMAELRDVKRYRDILATVLDTAYEAVVVVDAEGIITMLSKSYGEFLGIAPETAIGRPVTEVIENTRMHIVAKTGEAEIGQIQRIKGHDMVCNRIPIKRDGKVVGAVGTMLFRDVADLQALADRFNRLQDELEYYKGELKKHQGTKYCLDSIIGSSKKVEELRSLAYRVARTHSTVLIRGESGTGKELLAHAIHNASPRAMGPFVKVNCAALPENLLESELFGYREGAFTGARKGGQVGKFELAHGGTIFLDEIGDMPLNMQVKLLRVLQEKEIERLGESRPLQVDVRVVAATNQNLEEMVQGGRFREDLFYRLNVVTMEIPPLRERREDIDLLVEHLLLKLCRSLGCSRKGVAPEAMQVLRQYGWPGNVRELENVLERALNIIDGDVITISHLPYYLQRVGVVHAGGSLIPLRQAVEATERTLLKEALQLTRGNCLEAAKILQVSKSTLYEKIARYKLHPPA